MPLCKYFDNLVQTSSFLILLVLLHKAGMIKLLIGISQHHHLSFQVIQINLLDTSLNSSGKIVKELDLDMQ